MQDRPSDDNSTNDSGMNAVIKDSIDKAKAGMKAIGKLPLPGSAAIEGVKSIIDPQSSQTTTDFICGKLKHLVENAASNTIVVGAGSGMMGAVQGAAVPFPHPGLKIAGGVAGFLTGIAAQPAAKEISEPVGQAVDNVCRKVADWLNLDGPTSNNETPITDGNPKTSNQKNQIEENEKHLFNAHPNTLKNPNLNVYALNMHTLLINGVEKIISAIHQPQGLELHQYDPLNNTWTQLAKGPAWSFSTGFSQSQYYETIRTNVITINGEQRLIAMIRASGGLDSHEYNPKTNTWKQLNWGPLWSDNVGYACVPCYKSIRTEVITVNGKQQLLAMILAYGGLELHQYDPSNNAWTQLAPEPTWSYPNGFFHPQYYETIRTNVVTKNGEQRLIVMIRQSGGLDSHEYDPKTNTWKQLNWGPLWSDNVGYACVPYYKSIRTEVITVNGKQQLFAMILASGGLALHHFDPDKNVWNLLVNNTAPAFIKSLSDPKYYETISTAVIVVDGKEQLLVMVRDEQGIQFHQYDPSTAAWTEHKSHEAHLKNFNIAYGKTLLHIDQKKEQENKAIEEQKRQAEMQARQAAEEQKRQTAIAQAATEQQKRQAAIAQAEPYYNLALNYYKASQTSSDRTRWNNLVSAVQSCDMALAFSPGHGQASVLRNQVFGETGGRVFNQANNSYVQYDEAIGNERSSNSSADWGRSDRASSNQHGFFNTNHTILEEIRCRAAGGTMLNRDDGSRFCGKGASIKFGSH